MTTGPENDDLDEGDFLREELADLRAELAEAAESERDDWLDEIADVEAELAALDPSAPVPNDATPPRYGSGYFATTPLPLEDSDASN